MSFVSISRIPIAQDSIEYSKVQSGVLPLAQKASHRRSLYPLFTVLGCLAFSSLMAPLPFAPTPRSFERNGNGTNKKEDLSSNVFRPMALWHTVFINLLVGANCLERPFGYEGAENASAESDYAYARKWATSVDA
jgi:hypothetical protein